jgi:hypothetical protein
VDWVRWRKRKRRSRSGRWRIERGRLVRCMFMRMGGGTRSQPRRPGTARAFFFLPSFLPFLPSLIFNSSVLGSSKCFLSDSDLSCPPSLLCTSCPSYAIYCTSPLPFLYCLARRCVSATSASFFLSHLVLVNWHDPCIFSNRGSRLTNVSSPRFRSAGRRREEGRWRGRVGWEEGGGTRQGWLGPSCCLSGWPSLVSFSYSVCHVF